MKSGTVKEKFTSFFSRIGKRNMIIAASFVLVAAVLVASIVMFGNADNGYDYSQGVGAQPSDSTPAGTDKNEGQQSAADTYFSSVQVNRQRTRDEALEVLQGVVDNASSTETAKNEALAEINKMAQTMEDETNIETLIIAKGFEECVAVINGDSANIVVKSEGLQAAQISQINEIVYEQAGILPVNIKIIER